ncbi:MAG: UbiA family prenyltransferase [Caldilineaceae bacterium]
MNSQTIANCIIHLRLNYQILLAPIFVWGYLLAQGEPDARFWVAFLALHLFLYGGTTAFNSYYDRDEGPVGGLEKPPPAQAALLPFSLVMQAVGAVLAAFVNPAFLLIYLTIFVMASLYSLPGVRLKGRPILGLITVGVGQGVLAALAGWAAAQTPQTFPGLSASLGILAVALVTIGFYPITQIYQIEEDAARGDNTFAVWAGPARAFVFSIVVQAFAAILLAAVIYSVMGLWQALLVGLFYGALLVATIRWALQFDPANVLGNYRRVMRINRVTSLGFLAFLVLNLFILA